METFTLQTQKGRKTALMSKGHSQHIHKEFEVIEDTITKEGLRKIVLKEKETYILKQKVNKLVQSLLKALNEPDSKLLKSILEDHLRDFEENAIDKMQKMVDSGKPVKKREGCFKIIIGDGRKRIDKSCFKLLIAE